MGSDSDLPVMAKAAEVLEAFGVEFQMAILSAHRTPVETMEFAARAEEEGYGVLIAGAGMAAHLPGVLAAKTSIPVVGVPIACGPLRGEDALYSMVQMRSEEHTSELQSRENLVCRLLLEKKNGKAGGST